MSSNPPDLPDLACLLLVLRGVTILKNYKYQEADPKKVFCDASLEDYAESRANGLNASSSFQPHDSLRLTYAAASLFVPGNEVVAVCQPNEHNPTGMIWCEKSSSDDHAKHPPNTRALNTLSLDTSRKPAGIILDSPVDDINAGSPQSDDSAAEPTTPDSSTQDPSFVSNTLDSDGEETGRTDRYLGYGMNLKEGFKRSDITATANAEEHQTASNAFQAETQNKHNFRLLPEGTSIWDRMKLNKTACLELQLKRETSVLSLEGHIATVTHYLENLRAFPGDLTRFSRRFSYYLISKCWPKMHRRIISWQALGFLNRLYHFSVSNAISEYEWASPVAQDKSDDLLSKLLSKFAVNFFTDEGGVATAFPPDRRPSFSKLLSAAHANATSEGACMPLYTRETAEEFHHFLVGTLIMYTRHLCYFVKEFKAAAKEKAKWKSDDLNIREEIEKSGFFRYSESLATWTRVLLYTLTSTAYRTHIEVCTAKGANVAALTPRFSEIDKYLAFGHAFVTINIVGKGEPANPFQGQPNPEDFENDDMTTPPEGASVDEFFHWTKSFLAQFFGKRIKECYYTQENAPEVQKVKVLAVDRIGYKYPTWERLQRLFLNATGNMTAAMRAAAVFREAVEAFPKPGEKGQDKEHDEAWKTINILRSVIKGDQGNKLYYLAPHCEAVLGAAFKFPNEAVTNGDEELLKICQSLRHADISVSKLCCPVCWELLRLLRHRPGDLEAHGCHSNIYALVLPEWLPKLIIDNLTTAFTIHLSREFDILANGRPDLKKIRLRRESVSHIAKCPSEFSEESQGHIQHLFEQGRTIETEEGR